MIGNKEINCLFEKYYQNNEKLLAITFRHSELVARKALEIATRKNLEIDEDFVYSASMLHDIGVVKCHAPSIYCYGNAPYICHGIEGGFLLREEGLPTHALVCERHTGSGLTKEEIKLNNLPLPPQDFLPISLEEKLICYADKFFSKSGDIEREKTFDEVLKSMSKFGPEALNRFKNLATLFETIN